MTTVLESTGYSVKRVQTLSFVTWGWNLDRNFRPHGDLAYMVAGLVPGKKKGLILQQTT